MDQGIIVAILSVLFYLVNLLSGGSGQPIQSLDPPAVQQSYQVLGQSGMLVAEQITVRSAPSHEAKALGTVNQKNDSLVILDYTPGWYKIRPNSGPQGWVPEYAVSITPTERIELNKMVLGFFTPTSSTYDSLLDSSPHLTGVSPLGWELDSYGNITANFDPAEMGRSLYFAGNQELNTYAHLNVANFPTKLLGNEYLQTNTINQLVDMVDEWGLKGLVINFAQTIPDDQTELVGFVKALADQMKQKGLQTLVSLSWDPQVDYAPIAAAVDHIILQTGKVEVTAGPITALPELEAALQEMVQHVPPNKIILSLITSGFSWARSGLPQELSHGEVLALAARQGASVKWDPESMSPYFSYGNGQEVWFENRYSLKYKFELISKYKLGGVALRNLGQEDPEIWDTLDSLIR